MRIIESESTNLRKKEKKKKYPRFHALSNLNCPNTIQSECYRLSVVQRNEPQRRRYSFINQFVKLAKGVSKLPPQLGPPLVWKDYVT